MDSTKAFRHDYLKKLWKSVIIRVCLSTSVLGLATSHQATLVKEELGAPAISAPAGELNCLPFRSMEMAYFVKLAKNQHELSFGFSSKYDLRGPDKIDRAALHICLI
jgi:hypothetical protein